MTINNKLEPLPPTNAAKLAAIAGLTTRHFNKLVRTGVVPKAKRGQFDTDAALAALVNYYRNGRQGSSDIAEEKLKHVVAGRREIEQRTATRARALVPIEDVRTVFTAAMVIVSSQLDGLAGRLANDVANQSDPAVCRKVIHDETRRIRTAAANELATLADDNSRRGNPPAADGTDAE